MVTSNTQIVPARLTLILALQYVGPDIQEPPGSEKPPAPQVMAKMSEFAYAHRSTSYFEKWAREHGYEIVR